MQVQFITHTTTRYNHHQAAQMALEGGCRWIQLRMKDASPRQALSEALRVQQLCKAYRAVFIIDDRVELAQQIRADGVHLGKNDMPIGQARRVLGKEYIIGATANTFEEAESHSRSGADYIGMGPFRQTQTKQNLSPIIGLQGYSRILHRMKEAGITLPVVAIGGIKREDISEIMATGVSGIALSGAILQAANPVEEMRLIMNLETTL